MHTTPQVVTLHQGNHGSLLDNRDLEFEQIIDRAFAGRAVSAVYLIGDGFDGDWMKRSPAEALPGQAGVCREKPSIPRAPAMRGS